MSALSIRRGCRGKRSSATWARPGKRKALRCKLPSGLSRRGATSPARRWRSIKRTRISNAPGRTTVSGLSSRNRWPRAACMPWLLAAPKPRLVALAISCTCGYAARSRSGVPSDEALSTTITSAQPPTSAGRSESRQSRSRSRTFQPTMITDSVGLPTGGDCGTLAIRALSLSQNGGAIQACRTMTYSAWSH